MPAWYKYFKYAAQQQEARPANTAERRRIRAPDVYVVWLKRNLKGYSMHPVFGGTEVFRIWKWSRSIARRDCLLSTLR